MWHIIFLLIKWGVIIGLSAFVIGVLIFAGIALICYFAYAVFYGLAHVYYSIKNL